MSVLLKAKFRHVGCPAALGGSSQKAGREHSNNEVFPASAHRRIRVTVCNVPVELSQNPSHLQTASIADITSTTPSLRKPLPPKPFQPNITPSNQTSPPLEQSSAPHLSLTLPSLSFLSPPRLFPRSHSASRQPKSLSDSSKTRHRAESASTEYRQGFRGQSLCSVESEEPLQNFSTAEHKNHS